MPREQSFDVIPGIYQTPFVREAALSYVWYASTNMPSLITAPCSTKTQSLQSIHPYQKTLSPARSQVGDDNTKNMRGPIDPPMLTRLLRPESYNTSISGIG